MKKRFKNAFFCMNHKKLIAPLTSHPLETCQAPKETRGNIYEIWRDTKRAQWALRLTRHIIFITSKKIWGVWFYFSWTPCLSSCLISAMTAFGSKDLVFSSTQFSGSKSVNATQVWMLRSYWDTANVQHRNYDLLFIGVSFFKIYSFL